MTSVESDSKNSSGLLPSNPTDPMLLDAPVTSSYAIMASPGDQLGLKRYASASVTYWTSPVAILRTPIRAPDSKVSEKAKDSPLLDHAGSTAA